MLTDAARYSLGDVDPAGSRHNWARSATAVADGTVFAGTADGRVLAHPSDPDADGWSASGDGSVVSMAAGDECLAVGARGADGYVSARSPETGERRWRYATSDDVGTASKDSLLFQPYVVDVARTAEGIVAAARRYERDGENRAWSSVVLGFDADGDVRWRYHASASPISLDVADGRVAVAYNRCTDDHVHGLVVLDSSTGDPVAYWDPGTEGDRRVGDVAFVGGDIAVASHGDKHGYLLDVDGGERWRVDLASERAIDGETVYAYPNHVCEADGTVVFVTGNTYAESTRDPDARHPREHTAVAIDGGEESWTHDVSGFARGVSASGRRVAVPSAQHFRERTADTHAVTLFDAHRGHLETRPISGIASAASLADEALAVVEEPVEYHDEGVRHGAYRLHTWQVGDAQ